MLISIDANCYAHSMLSDKVQSNHLAMVFLLLEEFLVLNLNFDAKSEQGSKINMIW